MPRQDHDQQFKTLIREFLREFIRLFFPEWYERFDLEKVEWLDKEIFLDPGPRGQGPCSASGGVAAAWRSG
jgi:hypothetical protein